MVPAQEPALPTLNGFRGSHLYHTVSSLLEQTAGVRPTPTPKSATLYACKCTSIIGGRCCFACDHARHPESRSRISGGQKATPMHFFMSLPCRDMGSVLLRRKCNSTAV